MRENGKSTGKNIGKKLLATALLVNSATYVGARVYWHMTGKMAAELKVVREVGNSGIANYLVAGNINNPKDAFECIESKIDGGIIYVNYAEKRGCSMKQILWQVLEDARQQHCKVRIFGISIGDYVGRFAEALLDDVETVAINPEPSSEFLRPYAKWGLRILTPLMEAATVPMGWLSYAISVRKEFSFAFLADQWRDIAYLNNAPNCVEHTIAVISSGYRDEFLLHDVIKKRFAGRPMEVIDVPHGTTEANPEVFAGAWDRLMSKSS